MDRRRLLFGVLALGILVTGYAVFFMSSEEDRIHEACDKLEEALRMPPDRGNAAFFALSLKAKLAELLTKDATFVVPESGQGALRLDAIVGGAMRLGEGVQTADVRLESRTIESLTDTSATVTAKAVVTALRGRGPERHERPARLELVKVDGDWRFAQVVAERPTEGEGWVP